MAESNESSGKDAGSDEIISLEKLVNVQADAVKPSTVAGAPVPPPKVDPKTAPAGASAAPAVSPANDELDRLLAVEDPAFAASLHELADLKHDDQTEVTVDNDLESILRRERIEAALKGPKKLYLLLVKRPIRKIGSLVTAASAWVKALRTTALPALKAGSAVALVKTKAGLKVAVAGVKFVTSKFTDLPRASKLLLVGVVLLGAASVAVGIFTFKKQLLPSFQNEFMTSFARVADTEFTFEEGAGWENLNDPFLHPEHIVLIDRIIANLKSRSGNPMTMLELFIETSSQEAAVELRDREAEARDVIGRTLNQMPYDEIVTVDGKNKVKVFLRKDLNSIMTKGRIRRVFFKSIILKP
ncbi:MAG: flagellar basal body-associated FliL family protein [Bdellovibrionota bacterium]